MLDIETSQFFFTVKSLNPISEVIEYWHKAQKNKIGSTNTKPFFWENQANVKTSRKLSPYIGVFYKFVSKSVKSVN